MDTIEIIASVVGLLAYWFLTSKKQKKGNKPQKPNRPPMSMPQQSERYQSPQDEYVEFTDPRYEAGGKNSPQYTNENTPRGPESNMESALKDLLEAFDSKQKYQEKYVDRKKLIDEKKAEANAQQQLGDRYSPEVVEKRAYEQGMKDYWDDYEDYESDLLPADKKKVEQVKMLSTQKATKKKKTNTIADLLKDPESIRNGIIMKEILERPDPDRWDKRWND